LIAILIISVFSQVVFAQGGDLVVQGVSPKLYVSHKVAAKENWYSIGRIYNISPKELAPFNNAAIDKPLSVGQSLKIPLAASNFSQDGSKAADEVFVPVYYTVQEKEWMYRISQNNNKVPIENLEKWNNVNKDQVKPGMQLIVGFLKVKKDQSSLASRGSTTVPTGTAKTVAASQTVTTNTGSIEKTTQTDKPAATVKESTTAPVTTTAVSKPVVTAPVENKPIYTSTSTNGMDSKAGYFSAYYSGSGKSMSGTGNIFKSTSGWQDGKYYALVNNVSVGTIVKVTNPGNRKFIYAKVLGSLPDMKESVGLVTRISDAAAGELGLAEGKFSVELQY
jgi:LysM repeat protein